MAWKFPSPVCRFLKRCLIICSSIIVINLILSAILWKQAPDQFAVLWDGYGNPSHRVPRTIGMLLAPAFGTFVTLLAWGIMHLDPATKDLSDQAKAAMHLAIIDVNIAFVALHVVYLHGNISNPTQTTSPGIIMVVVGVNQFLDAFMLRLTEPNRWTGVRTPWVFRSDLVWDDTHRFAFYMYLLGSVFCFTVAAVAPTGDDASWVVLLVGYSFPPLFAIMYSFFIRGRGYDELEKCEDLSSQVL